MLYLAWCTCHACTYGTKELFNLPPLVLKARHLSGSAFCMSINIIGVSEQALGWLPLDWDWL